MTDVTCTASELPEARAQIDIEVSPVEVEFRIQEAAETLGGELKVPGFRKGKVPAEVVLQRVGRDALLEQAINDSISDWYGQALEQIDIAPVGTPKFEQAPAPAIGEPLRFTVSVPVRPEAKLGEYKGLEVGRREVELDQEAVDHELEHLRERFATLETVERPGREGDFLMIDFEGKLDGEPFEGGSSTGQLLELGSGRFIEGFESALVGTVAGDERKLDLTFPPDYNHEELAGRPVTFEVKVQEVKEKRLRDIDDAFASEVGGFETLAELRADLESRMHAHFEAEVESEYRAAAIDAAVTHSEVDVPHGHVHSRAHEMWHEMAHSLSHRGVDPRQYLAAVGKTEEEFVVEIEPQAIQSLRREATIAAIVEAEGITVTDEDLLEALRHDAERTGVEPDELLDRVREAGGEKLLRRDVAMKKAADVIVAHATAIPAEQAAARESIWTPEKEEREAATEGGKLWTPGS